mgnify:CR=1 FL=1
MGHAVPEERHDHRTAKTRRGTGALGPRLADHAFRAIVENVGEGVSVVDEDERFVYVNDAGAEILGIPREELIGASLLEFVSEEDWSRLADETGRRRGGERGEYELAVRRTDGKKRHVIVTVSPRYDDEGRYDGTFGMFHDITERKAVEELVRRRSRDLAERVKELQCLYSIMQKLHSHARTDAQIARDVASILPSGWQYPGLACARVVVGPNTYASKKFSETRWGMSSSIIVGGEEVGSVEVFYTKVPESAQDDPFLKEERYLLDAVAEQLSRAIEHSRAERNLMQSRETAQMLIDNFPGGAVLLDLDLNVIAVNMNAASQVGRAPSDVVGRPSDELFEGRLREHRLKVLRRVASTGEAAEEEVREDGRVYSVRVHPVPGADGAVERLAIFARDVTEEKKAEREIRRSEAKYRSVFDLSPEAIVLMDRKGSVVDVNGRIEDWLGYPRDEIVGRNILFLPFIPKKTKGRLMKRFLERMAGRPIPPYDVSFVTKNGDEKTGRIHGTVLTDDEGSATHDLVMISDVTEQKRAELATAEAGRKLEELHGVVKRFAECRELGEIYPLITEAARSILSIDACGFFVEEDGMLELAATCCRGREAKPEPMPVDEAGHLGEAFRTGRMQLFTSDDDVGGMPAPEGFERGLSFPAEDLGVLHCFAMTSAAFTTDDVRLTDLLLDHARQAAGRIRLENRLHEEAIRDRLTGLYNRNYFQEAVERETERSRRSGEPIGFLMVDIDRFKQVNDTHGHVMGDDVLRGVARFLAGHVRTSEIVVRYGGDEFLIMMPGLAGEPGPVCARIREAFERWREASGIPDGVDFDLSMGFARWEPYDLTSVTETLSKADEAMYEDKRSHAAAGAGRPGPRASESVDGG